MEGRVTMGNTIIGKSGELIPRDSKIEITPKSPYVSRGGLKLEGVFSELDLDASGKLATDIGSSTGGFTDFLLKNGAEKITAIDVGYGLLAWELRKSNRVHILERTNVRHLDIKKLPYKSDITTVDVSFISIKKIIKKILELTKENGDILLLFKPQFELQRQEVKNKGIVKDSILHRKSLKDMARFLKGLPVVIEAITFSRIKGTKGNIEFWIYLRNSINSTKSNINYDKIIDDVISNAHIFFQ